MQKLRVNSSLSSMIHHTFRFVFAHRVINSEQYLTLDKLNIEKVLLQNQHQSVWTSIASFELWYIVSLNKLFIHKVEPAIVKFCVYGSFISSENFIDEFSAAYMFKVSGGFISVTPGKLRLISWNWYICNFIVLFSLMLDTNSFFFKISKTGHFWQTSCCNLWSVL